MRLSELFFTTLREAPAEMEMPSARLLVRAGYIRQLASGIFTLLPLGFRVAQRGEEELGEAHGPLILSVAEFRLGVGIRRGRSQVARVIRHADQMLRLPQPVERQQRDDQQDEAGGEQAVDATPLGRRAAG
jgi:hypothetical protein